MNDLCFGLVGYGLWGAHHAKAIAKTPGARLVAIAERSEEGRAAAQETYPEVEVDDDYRRLLAREDLAVVDVVVPSHLHYEIARTALEADKHLFLEKPMVLSLGHCDELIRLARQKGKILAVDHEMRLSALWGRVKQLIDQAAVGTPQYVLLELSRFPYRLGSEGWRFDVHRVGNWILEEPIHFFDLARWYMAGFGEAVSVYARANSRQPGHPELQDNFTTILSFSGGGYAVISQTLAAFEHHVTCKVSGTQGAIWANWSAPDARHPQPVFGLRYGDHNRVEAIRFESVTGEVVELADFVAAIVRSVREGTPPPASGEDGRWSVLLCLAAQASVDTGAPIDVGQFAKGRGGSN
jgi:myo-inositol 2-dehydrogenase/D-chiro-inositol 1-dehydrogenase